LLLVAVGAFLLFKHGIDFIVVLERYRSSAVLAYAVPYAWYTTSDVSDYQMLLRMSDLVNDQRALDVVLPPIVFGVSLIVLGLGAFFRWQLFATASSGYASCGGGGTRRTNTLAAAVLTLWDGIESLGLSCARVLMASSVLFIVTGALNGEPPSPAGVGRALARAIDLAVEIANLLGASP
jgi:hypothetical protein